MKAFQTHKGLAAVLDHGDVDTDQIIPKQFLKKIERTGFGQHLFHDWRFLDSEGKVMNLEFELNRERYLGATVLLTGENFGCGSSREHAPWALQDYGFCVIIAPSFADIFYGNCIKNGLLPIHLPTTEVRSLIAWVQATPGAEIAIDLPKQVVVGGGYEYAFEIDSFQKENLLHGIDEIALGLQHEEEITRFEAKHFQSFPFYSIS